MSPDLTQIAPDDTRFLTQFVQDATFVVAKTMPTNPHEYTVRGKTSEETAFVRFVELLREYGWDGKFGGRKYRYLDVNGYSYWTMGAAINTPAGAPYTIILNRKPVGEVEGEHGVDIATLPI
jgi:hypothetical protein